MSGCRIRAFSYAW